MVQKHQPLACDMLNLKYKFVTGNWQLTAHDKSREGLGGGGGEIQIQSCRSQAMTKEFDLFESQNICQTL